MRRNFIFLTVCLSHLWSKGGSGIPLIAENIGVNETAKLATAEYTDDAKTTGFYQKFILLPIKNKECPKEKLNKTETAVLHLLKTNKNLPEIPVDKNILGGDLPGSTIQIENHFLDQDTVVKLGKGNMTFKANTSFEEIENVAEKYMIQVNNDLSKELNKLYLSSWLFQSNLTEHNKNITIERGIQYGAFSKQKWKDIQTWKELWPRFSNDFLKRQFKLQSVLGIPALSEERYAEWSSLLAELAEIYSSSTVCDYKNSSKCDLSLEPDLVQIMGESRDYDELTHVWKAWRDAVGQPMRALYSNYVAIGNEAAKLNDLQSMADLWIHSYEDDSFEDTIKDLYDQVKPLYSQLHAYARRKLREVYGEDRVTKKGPIPAHLLGNMWAQTWANIYDLLIPYPNKTKIDVTEEMVSQNYTPKSMFEKGDDFFASLGLERVPPLFWNNSILEKPTDRKIVCHASAWDFRDGNDFRIKQCTVVNTESFETVHHELGHVQYSLQYKNLPTVFKRGANQGFHEAIGDVMSLSVATPKHLHEVGLLESIESDYEADINFLMSSALRKVAFLPFGYMIDRFRWDTFRGRITPDNYTCSWWNYRYELQGIKPPVPRTEEDFDPGAKYHVAANYNYIHYFVSYILQFQFHKALCELAGEYDPLDPKKPLHQCDIYQSIDAGNALRSLLQLGSSEHWTVPLKKLTGTDKMDLSAWREYFKPLEQWLKEDNEKHGEFIGWEGGIDTLVNANVNASPEGCTNIVESGHNSTTKDNISETHHVLDKDEEVAWVEGNITLEANTTFDEIERIAEEYMKHVNDEYGKESNTAYLSNWLFESNITEHNKNISIDSEIKFGAYKKRVWTDLQTWKELWPKFANDTLKRQFKLQSVLGVPALSADKYAEWSALLAELNEIYSTGTICHYKNSSKCDLTLEPDLVEIMANSRNYDELTHVWKAWRDAVGRPMRTLYPKYVALGNEAAELNGFRSLAELWTHDYEDDLFEYKVKDLYHQQMKPLYSQLHAYTRRKLREVYGEENVPKKLPIPAHLLGNMWAQSWENIYDLLQPYPNKTSIDVKDAMVSQKYTPRIIFEKTDDFFASLGLERVPPLFWNNSILEKPTDRKIVCHASAWDFNDGKDFRIKQCTKVNMDHFETAHHEMGHIQYDLQYKELPSVFKDGANPGFHEAIGDVMSLSVSTPKHLHKVGLLESIESDYEADINFLMSSALRKVAFLPFAYMIDRFRWDTFRGQITPDNYTCSWWNYRYELQGIKPPVPRTEEDFDPGAKYHVAANYNYIHYFVSYILQFQFHKALCELAGEYDPLDPEKPLHQCDIYQSIEAGNALRSLLQLGTSEHWTVPLKKLTGTDRMDLSAWREYFKPLEQWLKEDNEKHGEFIGWEGVAI